ncbi:hypothetical protein V1523DRAFT_397831 [Lipomyces doorenjongii]
MPHFSPVSEDSFVEPACQALTQEKGSDPVELTPDKEAGSPSYSLPLDFWSQLLLYAGPGGYALVARIYELKYKQRMKALPGWHNIAAVASLRNAIISYIKTMTHVVHQSHLPFNP